METANILARKNQVKFKELFNLAYFKPLGVSIGLMFIQQFSGINAVMFYSVSIFRVIITTWGNLRIILTLSFYVKSILKICELLKMPFS